MMDASFSSEVDGQNNYIGSVEEDLAVVNLRLRVAAAFAAVYIIWGSTYLAISFVIETLPLFFMASTRFLVAGLILYVWASLRGASQPSSSRWGSAFLIGGLMLLGGHGAVVWAEQWVPSGLTALLIATVPLWMVLSGWLRGGSRPNVRVTAGLMLGFVGVALLAGGVKSLGESHVDLASAVVLVVGLFLGQWVSLLSFSPTSFFSIISYCNGNGCRWNTIACSKLGDWRMDKA